MHHSKSTAQLSLSRLKSLTDGNPEELRVLIEKALESLEEAYRDVFQASLSNNVADLRATVHKITPLLHYLQAEKILNIVGCCVQTILRSTSSDELNAHYQLILKNIHEALRELSEKALLEY